MCGKRHRANDKHSREKVNAAVAKVKAKKLAAIRTVNDLAFSTQICEEIQGEDGDDLRVEWAEYDSD